MPVSSAPLPTSHRPSSGNLGLMEPNSKALKAKHQDKTTKTIKLLVKILVAILVIEVLGIIAAFFIPGTPPICLIILGGLILTTVLCVLLLVIKLALVNKTEGTTAEQQIKRKLSSKSIS
ncbi:hypothetical protein CpB0383 [Chlamydia pneumoniae TW-183]|uniref:Uncharacterized protein n=2 Tax=Chlamydia pneumoniae TaxID=83558 RepID=Q9Z8H2_CHLPN|nr:hypothetical protein [Chlamydia pneumoniae]AAD18515.1 hypothetical protein CPn_0371 [Chlamydia pneumoniae CWL029]AAF38233.1 hypothetical protein CP_0386 [Chlamydia pneumoniae AR39]AAP98314.1 hypothetical protein CpB0383 [Chlamydia pneumoniae TW-183]CRI32873.1 Uncharacterized protein BN1224_Wien1_A_03800 [Chlamydia pneumoniae]CRI35736.1 Uncharacterized protein BN1224_CM1_A_03830 [Chlamydia pneumoniae]